MDRPVFLLYNYDMIYDPSRVQIHSCHLTDCWPNWSWRNPRILPNAFLLWVIERGRGTLTTATDVLPLRAGDCYLMRLRDEYFGQHDKRTPLTVPWAIFRYLDEMGNPVPVTDSSERRLPPLHRRLENLSFTVTLFDRAIDAFLAGDKQSANRWMGAVLMEITRRDGEPNLAGPRKEQHEAVRALCERIRSIPARPWRVNDMARALHYSPDHFRRIFRDATGMTPGAFVVQARVDEAKGLLTLSSHSISRIAEILGYGDVYHFSRQFKEKTGMSPSAYRHG